MKLETFFEKFDLFADAPDAVAKMRELVLQLGGAGKTCRARPQTTNRRSNCLKRSQSKAAAIDALERSRQRSRDCRRDWTSDFDFPSIGRGSRFGDVASHRLRIARKPRVLRHPSDA